MGQYLGKRVVLLLRAYLCISNVCGFVVFGFSAKKKCIVTAKWRRTCGMVFAIFYFPVAIFSFLLFVQTPLPCYVLLFNISSAGVLLYLIFIILLQWFHCHGLVSLLNEFPVVLSQVYQVSHRKIVFDRMFGVRSFLQFIPMFNILLKVVFSLPSLRVLVLVFVVKVIPDILVEMLHHTVYIALYAIAKMYENLNETMMHEKLRKSRKIRRVYCGLHQLTEKMSKFLSGYFLLHIFLDCFMLLALIVAIILQCYSMEMLLILTATTFNKLRTLMTVADEISYRSRFFRQSNHCQDVLSALNEKHFRLCGACTISKPLFLSLLGKLSLFLIITNQFLRLDPGRFSNYIISTN